MAGLTGEMAVAQSLERAGKLDEAEAVYRHALKECPDAIAALNHLGLLCHRRGRHAEAAALIERALSLRPCDAEALGNLGAVQVALGELPTAISNFRRAAALLPGSAAAWSNLGKALLDSGDATGAVDAYRQAVVLEPASPQLRRQLARSYYADSQFGLAAEAYARAAADDPKSADNWSDLGAACHHLGDLTAAGAALREALRLNDRHVAAWRNLGAVSNDEGDDEAAIACFDRAIELDPTNVDAHVFRGITFLRKAEFAEGWAEYEWRLVRQNGQRTEPRCGRPKWTGEDFRGRRLLIHAEQGFGDTIQFMRYLPMIGARGGEVLFEVQAPLYRLIAASPVTKGMIVFPRGTERPPFDLQCPLLSLPAIFGTDLTNLPSNLPYLFPDCGSMSCLPPQRQPRRCALVWSGNLKNIGGRNRSMPGTALDRLAGLRDVEFVSLQIDPVTRPEKLALVDAAPLLKDFAHTAQALSEVGTVITVDTAVAHLAGAMGKPAWVLLGYTADWRWLKGRSDSPWYPSLGLLRQPRPGDWDSMIERIADEMEQGG